MSLTTPVGPPSVRSETSTVIDARQAAALLGRDYWTVRSWILEGLIPRIQFPSPSRRRRKLRRLLVDRRDVLAFIEKCKQKASKLETFGRSR